ncbi:ubiquitin carboxyl-terminal hydrolase 12/46 [Rhodotorula toruloides]|uniref:ubiquitinyl hydrolase 1 n=1 Tax=Rhodotorula toruloides TaxID=5286 RepID=A0A511K947_RHOTO|nr:ubiquitin carboxyl-terminal hydrolase 12/46 [Rhodotorula toruloides]
MAFLRKWGGQQGGAAGVQATGTAGAVGGVQAGAPPVATEWFTELPGERYFGFENIANTCYANSILQSLYFSKPFRTLVESYRPYGSQPPAASPQPSSSAASVAPSIGPPASPSLPSSSSSAALSTLSSAGKAAKTVGNANATPYSPATPAPARPPPSSGRPGTAGSSGGGSRGTIFSATRRKNSLSSGTNDAAAPLSPSDPASPAAAFPSTLPTIAQSTPTSETTLLSTLHDLFRTISTQPKTLGSVAPEAFINQLKRDNEFFRSTLHQDAHELLNFLINSIAEVLEKEERKRAEDEGRPPSIVGTGFEAHAKTWVHSLFEGTLTNETRCLTCETVTSRDESFLDLSIDIEQNTSVTACLRQFSASEMLCQRNKFSCDRCCGLQEAERRMKIKKLPNVLALHLKRFKYEESLQRHVKLTYRVVFPFELRLFNTADNVSNPDRLYELWAIVVHIGVGPHHGHYIAIVKSGKRWIVFDDNNVYPIEQNDISRYFGDTPGQGSGYILFYQATDLDWTGLDVPIPPTPSVAGTAISRDRAQTTSTISTGGLGVSIADEGVHPVPPLPPASINTASPPDGPVTPPNGPSPSAVPPALIDPMGAIGVTDVVTSPPPAATAQFSTVSTAPARSNGYPVPPPQQRKSSVVSLSGSSAGTPEVADKKEGGGWSSLRGKFSRSKSQASGVNGKERRMSMSSAGIPSMGGPVPLSPVPSANGGAGVGDNAVPSGAVAAADFAIADSSSSGSPPANTAESSPQVNGSSTMPVTPPSEDGSASVHSSAANASAAATPAQPAWIARRRDSRNSFGTPDGTRPTFPSSSASSTSASLSSSGVLPSPTRHQYASSAATPPAPSSSFGSKTLGFLSRNRSEKQRPATSHAAPPQNGIGLGLGPAGLADPTAPGKARLSSAPAGGDAPATSSKRPATASASASSSHTSASRAEDAANSSPSDSGVATNGQSTPAPAAPTLTRKELEKRLKEEQKAREREAKDRAKAEKERSKQEKEDGKRQDKLRRKLSVR